MTVKVELAADNNATSWNDITDLVYLEGAVFSGTADHGQIDTGSGFDLRDDAGIFAIPKRRRVRVTETATTPDTIIWQGRTVGDEVRRGAIKTGDAKQFDVNLVDVNADFGGIAFAGTSRPEEHDTDRIQYLLDTYIGAGQTRPSTVIGDAYFSTANPYLLKAHVYSGVQLIDWFTHMTDTTLREFFLTNTYDLFYDTIGSTAYAAGISITDDGPDFSTSFPPGEPHATEDGTELFTRVRFLYSGGRVVSVVHSAAETANDQWGTSIVDEGVTSATAASTQADVFLNQFDHEATTYACWVELPASMVDQLSWGMTISFRSAAAGITTPTTFRVSRCSWSLAGEGRWRADLELNVATKYRRRSSTGGAGGTTPFVPDTVPDTSTDLNLVFGTDSDGGGNKTFSTPTNANDGAATTAVVGSFAAGAGTYTAYLVADLGSARTVTSMIVWGEQGCSTDPTADPVNLGWTIQYADSGGGPWTNATYSDTWNGLPINSGGKVEYTLTPVSHRYWRVRWQEISGSLFFSCGTEIRTWEIFGGTTSTPTVGQNATEATTGDGSTTIFQTNVPYYENSLTVTVEGISVIPTQTDPTSGTFTLPFAPAMGANIVMNYQAAPGEATGAGNTPPPSTTPAGSTPITELDDIPDVNAPSPSDGDVLTWDSTPGEWVSVAPASGNPADDTAAWMPLTTVVGGDPELVWDGDDSLIPTLTPLS